jgi:hypothetical protein
VRHLATTAADGMKKAGSLFSLGWHSNQILSNKRPIFDAATPRSSLNEHNG